MGGAEAQLDSASVAILGPIERITTRRETRMPTSRGSGPLLQLSDEQLVDLLTLTKAADSVELKLTVPELRSTVAALGMDPLDAQIRQVYFFDTPDLLLDRHGIVMRARRVQRRGDDSVVKLRPVTPDELSAHLRASPNFNVEVDAMPGGYVCSGSLKGIPKVNVREAIGGAHPLRKLFSKEQRALFATRAPKGIEINELSVLGPIFVLKLRFVPSGAIRRMVAELWFYPDSSTILELSTKCAPNEALQVAGEGRAFLAERGVDLSGGQQTKTRKALQLFSKRLATSRQEVSS